MAAELRGALARQPPAPRRRQRPRRREGAARERRSPRWSSWPAGKPAARSRPESRLRRSPYVRAALPAGTAEPLWTSVSLTAARGREGGIAIASRIAVAPRGAADGSRRFHVGATSLAARSGVRWLGRIPAHAIDDQAVRVVERVHAVCGDASGIEDNPRRAILVRRRGAPGGRRRRPTGTEASGCEAPARRARA